MQRIGLLSDTHGWLDPELFELFAHCHEIWHAGDVGDPGILQALATIAPIRAVWGNIDGPDVRAQTTEWQRFQTEGFNIWITHIAGRPGRYNEGVRQALQTNPPDVLIAGHSHMCSVERDAQGVLFLNPGAAGRSGFHTQRTALRLELVAGQLPKIEALELGPSHMPGHTH